MHLQTANGSGADHDRLITVVVPTRNRSRWLEDAIASVLSSSPLISSPQQVVVVDDDSDDDTEIVARKLGVRYRKVAFRSASLTRNAGLEAVDTPYVAFFDDDDVWLPGNMEAQLAALESNPKAAFAFGVAQCVTADLEPLPWRFPEVPLAAGIDPEGLHLGYPNLGAVLFRREVVETVGGFEKKLRYYQDAELMLRVAARHEIVGVDVMSMLYRLRPPSRVRSNHHWTNRRVVRWRPTGLGIGWKTSVVYRYRQRRMHFYRFLEDAAACAEASDRRDSVVCATRAIWISPGHAFRHPFTVARSLRPTRAVLEIRDTSTPGDETSSPDASSSKSSVGNNTSL